jgi:hypothetical protein
MISRCVRSRVMYVAGRVTIRRARRDRRAPLSPWIISVPWRTCVRCRLRGLARRRRARVFSAGASGRRRGQFVRYLAGVVRRRADERLSSSRLLALGLRQWRPARSCVLTQRCSDVALAAASLCRAEDATSCIITFLPACGCGAICRRRLKYWLAVGKTLGSARAASVKAETRPLCGCQVCN